MSNPTYTKYFGPFNSGMEYFTKLLDGKFEKWKVRQRLTVGTRSNGMTVRDSETPEQFQEYREALAGMRKQGLIFIKE